MRITHRSLVLVALVLGISALSCRAGTDGAPPAAEPPAAPAAPDSAASPQAVDEPPIIQPGAPGQPSRRITRDEATDLSAIQHTEADVRFMQGMIGHHAQALEMSAPAAAQAGSEGVRMLAHRIDLSQQDEIRMMQEWLAARGEDVPALDHHHHGGMLMPGMLTAEQMSELLAAQGTDFDRLFLRYMIQHHSGALTMVENLLAQPGAGQETTIAAFIADVVADQGAEMDRMAAMLRDMPEQE